MFNFWSLSTSSEAQCISSFKMYTCAVLFGRKKKKGKDSNMQNIVERGMLSLNDCFLIEVWLIYDTVINRVYGKMIQLYIYFQIISGINRYKPLQKINELDKHQGFTV